MAKSETPSQSVVLGDTERVLQALVERARYRDATPQWEDRSCLHIRWTETAHPAATLVAEGWFGCSSKPDWVETSDPPTRLEGNVAKAIRDFGEQYVCPTCGNAWADDVPLFCECDTDGKPWDHGRSPAQVCPSAHCTACGWRGNLPQPGRLGLPPPYGWGTPTATIDEDGKIIKFSPVP